MNRCLHITIQENAGALPPRATAQLPGRAGTDPSADNVMPRLENPSADNVMPRLENPSDDTVMPRLENPDRIPYPSSAGGGYGAALATACSCCCVPACQDTAAPRKTTPHPYIGPRDYSGFVIVRMAPGIESTVTSLGQLAEEHKPKLTELQAVLKLAGTLVSKPLVELYGPGHTPWLRDQVLKLIHELEKKTASTAFPPLYSLASYWRLDLREHPGLVEEVVARLNSLPEVGLAYRELAATDPQDTANGQGLSEDQGYLGDAPIGISASWARKSLAAHSETASSKTPLTLCDLEQGWNLDHRDLEGQVVGPLFGVNRAQADNSLGHHGTAVLGQLAATGRNAFSVQGAVADLCRFVVASHYDQDGSDSSEGNVSVSDGNVRAAILQVLGRGPEDTGPLARLVTLNPGDILLIEVQRGKLPTEVDEADFNAIRLAAGLGIIVVEAAGNGGFDLDAYSDPGTGRSLRRGDPRFQDSGAILVGAARAGLHHDRMPFSNYGSRLDCFGQGEAVTTCGYGDLAGTEATDSYTNSFSGTSSASPIIAGAAALLQRLHETYTNMRLEPRAMREILADSTTGTRQGPNVPGHIGVMPDLKAIVRDRLQLVPDVYMRRSIGDDGSAPAAGNEISSSPDLLISSLSSARRLSIVRSLFGAGSPGENLAAPGEPVVPGGGIYLRLRNRGLGTGKVHVQLFASPAATLITPERWLPVSPPGLDIPSIPQGDTLFVAGPVRWRPPAVSVAISPSPQAWSLLAILSEPEEIRPPADRPYFNGMGGMPPGPPYFDWAEYLAFLRGPGVAWRNTHRVASTPEPAALTFWIAGTPDRARYFDFEVIQHLPAGATVTLQVPPALAAKLHQRQPWLGGGPGQLPKRPRTTIRGVELAAGTYAAATFKVEEATLTAGHSLAIRQLWRGEEVGRITWYFGPP